MRDTKAGATLPAATKKITLKRQDYFRLGQMIQASTASISGGLVIYKPDASDEAVAAMARKQMGDAITPAIVARTRQSLFGSLPGEKGSAASRIQQMQQQLLLIQKHLAIQDARILALEQEFASPDVQPVSKAPYPSNGIRR